MSSKSLMDMVAASGDDGRAWLDINGRAELMEIEHSINRALELLRDRRFELGDRLLAAASADVSAICGVRPSIVHRLERYLSGALAYKFYCVGDVEQAHLELVKADQAVRAAVSNDRFLLPMAHACLEFHLHHARISRNAGHFSDMCASIAIVRDMVANQRPLCELADGTRVDYALLARHCESLSTYSDDARMAAERYDFDNMRDRQRNLDRFIQHNYMLQGMVVPAPQP